MILSVKYITFYAVVENVSPKTIQMEINYYVTIILNILISRLKKSENVFEIIGML